MTARLDVEAIENYWQRLYEGRRLGVRNIVLPTAVHDAPGLIQTLCSDTRTLVYVPPRFNFGHILQLFSVKVIIDAIGVPLEETGGLKNSCRQHGWLLVESAREAPYPDWTWGRLENHFGKIDAQGITLTTYAAFALHCRDSVGYPDTGSLIAIHGTTWKGRNIAVGFVDGELILKPTARPHIRNGRSATPLLDLLPGEGQSVQMRFKE